MPELSNTGKDNIEKNQSGNSTEKISINENEPESQKQAQSNKKQKSSGDKQNENQVSRRRGRPPKKKVEEQKPVVKTDSNVGKDIAKTEEKKNTSENPATATDKPKKRRGRPPKKLTAQKEASATKKPITEEKKPSVLKSDFKENSIKEQITEKPKKRRGRPPKKKTQDQPERKGENSTLVKKDLKEFGEQKTENKNISTGTTSRRQDKPDSTQRPSQQGVAEKTSKSQHSDKTRKPDESRYQNKSHQGSSREDNKPDEPSKKPENISHIHEKGKPGDNVKDSKPGARPDSQKEAAQVSDKNQNRGNRHQQGNRQREDNKNRNKQNQNREQKPPLTQEEIERREAERKKREEEREAERKRRDDERKNKEAERRARQEAEQKAREEKERQEKELMQKKIEQKLSSIEIFLLPKKKRLTKSQRNDPLILKFLNDVKILMEKEFFVESKNKIVVAVSGGIDSAVLLDILAQLSESMQFNVYVAHFNHKLRDSASDRDEDFVKNIAKDYNFQYFTASGNVKAYSEKNSVSIEHAARTLRYNFYERTSRTINAEYVATAHNANDNTETFFINLFRGSGLTGLSGIPACRQLVKNVRMIRPLINFAKKDIRDYAAKRKLKWMEDDSNRLLDFTRNKIRLDLIPKIAAEYNPAIIEVVNRTSRLLNGIDHFVSEYVKNSIPSVARDITTERFSLDIVALDTFEEVIQKEIIQGAWEKYFRTQPLSMMNIDKIMALKESETGTIYNLNKNIEILKDRRKLIFFKKKAENRINLQIKGTGKFNIGKGTLVITEVKPDEVEYNDSRHVEYVEAGLLPMVLEARNWEEGDRFMPLGAPGEMLVSDFFINEKVPLIDKQSVLLLTNKVDIIWVIGYRINHKYKVDARSEKIYRLEYFKQDK